MIEAIFPESNFLDFSLELPMCLIERQQLAIKPHSFTNESSEIAYQVNCNKAIYSREIAITFSVYRFTQRR